jgi:hypothetical protein
MSRMRFCLVTLVVVVCSLSAAAARPVKVEPVSPQDLARIWDAEHVSSALPPLMDHDEVERACKLLPRGIRITILKY